MYFLGIDGGGTKTAGVILSEDGAVVAAARSCGTAFIGAPPPEVRAKVRALRDDLLKRAGIGMGDIRYCAAGMNGVDFPDELEVQRKGIEDALEVEGDKLALVNDAIVALWGASDAPAAVLLQHGSGVTSALRAAYGQERLYDHLDSGKLFDIRHEAVKLVARMIDGRAPVSALKDDVLRHAGIADEDEYSEAVYRGRFNWEQRAGLVTVVYRAWERGDPGAAGLIESALADYALTAAAMRRKTGKEAVEIVFGGGVVDNVPGALWDRLAAKTRSCCPACPVRRPLLSPDLGAGIMAAGRAGIDPGDFYGKVMRDGPA